MKHFQAADLVLIIPVYYFDFALICEYYNKKMTAVYFVQLGLERYHGIGIIGFNSPEWFISDLGAIFSGFVVIYCQLIHFLNNGMWHKISSVSPVNVITFSYFVL